MAEVIGGMAGALQGTIGGVLNKGQSLLDRFFPPEKRNELWAKLSRFATEKPMLAVWIIFLSLISLSPVLLWLLGVRVIIKIKMHPRPSFSPGEISKADNLKKTPSPSSSPKSP